MRVELLALLTAHPIEHPTRIDRAIIEQDRLELLVSGYPWRRPGASHEDEGRITLGFEGLAQGDLPAGFDNDYGEALEDFEVRRLGAVAWAQPASHAIECLERLPDPAALYAKLQGYLAESGAFVGMGEFLFGAGRCQPSPRGHPPARTCSSAATTYWRGRRRWCAACSVANLTGSACATEWRRRRCPWTTGYG